MNYYVDMINGLDANAGTSWAAAKRTVFGAESLAADLSNDEVWIAKTPSLTLTLGGSAVNLTWGDGSQTVTLASELTHTITISTGAWTASANVFCSTDTANRKLGTSSAVMGIASAFTTGLAAYCATGTALTTLSAYDSISFFGRLTCPTTAFTITGGSVSLILCSDTAGATAIATLTIPYNIPVQNAVTSGQRWFVCTIPYGVNQPTITVPTALPNGVQSVGLYIHSDITTQTVSLNLTHLMASSSVMGLDLQTLISPNGTGEDATWWTIQSIQSNIIVLGETGSTALAPTKYYYGTTPGATKTITGYSMRPAVQTGSGSSGGDLWALGVSSSATTYFTPKNNGASPDSKFKIIGGYNTATNLVDGITLIGGFHSLGYGYNTLSTSTATKFANHISLQNLWFTKFYQGFELKSGNISTDLELINCGCIGNFFSGIQVIGSTNVKITKLWLNQNSGSTTAQLVLEAYPENVWIDQMYINTSPNAGNISCNATKQFISNSTIQGGANGLQVTAAGKLAQMKIYNSIFKNHTAADFIGATPLSIPNAAIYEIELYNCSLRSSTEVAFSQPNSPYSYIISYNHDQVAGTKKWGKYYSAISDTTITCPCSGGDSMKYTMALVSGTTNLTSNQLDLEIMPRKFRAKKNRLPITASVWVYPNLNYQGGSINIMRKVTPEFGDTSDVILGTLTASVTISVWTGMTVTINPALTYWNNNDRIDSMIYVKLNSATPTTTSTVSGSINIGDFTKTDYSALNSVISFG